MWLAYLKINSWSVRVVYCGSIISSTNREGYVSIFSFHQIFRQYTIRRLVRLWCNQSCFHILKFHKPIKLPYFINMSFHAVNFPEILPMLSEWLTSSETILMFWHAWFLSAYLSSAMFIYCRTPRIKTYRHKEMWFLWKVNGPAINIYILSWKTDSNLITNYGGIVWNMEHMIISMLQLLLVCSI